MIRKISKDEQLLLNTLSINLPQENVFVSTQVTAAVGIAKKYLESVSRKYDTEDNMYLHALRVAVDVSEIAKKNSENGFFRYDLVIIALLHDVIEDADCPELQQELGVFRTLGKNTILDGINALSNDENKLAELGKAKYMSMKFTELSKNLDLFTVKLMDRIDNLACLALLDNGDKEQSLFISNYLLQTLVIYNNLCMQDFYVDNSIYKHYNEMVTMILSDFKY